jgi:N-acetylated-alpha-linked acidic dipeptidase
VLERLRARGLADGSATTPEEGDIPIYPLGSGSDYSPFLQHAGISSLNLSFGGESSGGSYHSVFDSFEHYTRFGDTDFAYGVTLAKVAGRATLRLANAEMLPFRFETFVGHVADYADEVEALADKMREETAKHNKLVESGVYELSYDPQGGIAPPAVKSPVPHISFAVVHNAVEDLRVTSGAADKAVAGAVASPELNKLLARLERSMASDDGLPRRPWFRHQIYAPGYYTGYGVKTLPGIREAIEERKWEEADEQMIRVAATLTRISDAFRDIAKEASK